MSAQNESDLTEISWFRGSCIILDGVLAAIFVGKGLFYGVSPEIQSTGFALQFFLAHLAVAFLLVLGAFLLAKRRKGGVVVQVFIFLLMATIVVVTLFFNPAHSPDDGSYSYNYAPDPYTWDHIRDDVIPDLEWGKCYAGQTTVYRFGSTVVAATN